MGFLWYTMNTKPRLSSPHFCWCRNAIESTRCSHLESLEMERVEAFFVCSTRIGSNATHTNCRDGWLTFLLRTFKMGTFVSTACSLFRLCAPCSYRRASEPNRSSEPEKICISITRRLIQLIFSFAFCVLRDLVRGNAEVIIRHIKPKWDFGRCGNEVNPFATKSVIGVTRERHPSLH